MTEQPRLFTPPDPTCQRVACSNRATVRVHIDYGATGPSSCLLCVPCADQHARGDEIPLRYQPANAPLPEGY